MICFDVIELFVFVIWPNDESDVSTLIRLVLAHISGYILDHVVCCRETLCTKLRRKRLN